MSCKQRAWLFLGGGIGVLVGSFTTWVELTPGFVGNITASGVDGDGKLTAVAGAVAVAGGWFVLRGRPKRWLSSLSVFASLAALGIALYNLYHAYMTDVTGAFGDQVHTLAAVSPGWGLYLTLAAAVVALTGAFLAIREPEVARNAF